MYDVLLVDDEPLITEGLSILIDWNQLGFSRIETACDGEEALSKIKITKFDLIITDIRMPGLNGLNLIKSLKTESPSTKIVILSGYSDFSYAKEAMQYGVKSYLLKPISKDEITEIVMETKNELDAQFHNYTISTKKEQLINDKLLLDIVTGINFNLEILNVSNNCTLNFSSNYYCCCLFEVSHLKTHQFELIKYGIRNILSDLFELKNIGYLYEDEDNLIGLILYSNVSEFLNNDIYNNINEAISCINDIFKIKIRCYLGDLTHHVENLNVSRRQALYARKQKFIFNDLALIPYTKVVLDKNLKISIKWDNTILLSSIEEMNISTTRLQLDLLFEEITKNKLDKNIINSIMYNNFFSLQNLIKKYNAEPLDILDNRILMDFMNSYDEIKSLEDFFMDMCNQVGLYLTEIGRLKSPNVIEEIKKYIDDNLSENLSLKSIALNFFLNPSYLGRLFKSSTQESFNDYLNKKRISQLKKLFVNSNLKINEILEKVGYSSPEYFYKLFKKYEKISFSDYSNHLKMYKKT